MKQIVRRMPHINQEMIYHNLQVFKRLNQILGDSDHGITGDLYIYLIHQNDFYKTFRIKIFKCRHEADYAFDIYVAGYFNTTSAVNAMQFKWLQVI